MRAFHSKIGDILSNFKMPRTFDRPPRTSTLLVLLLVLQSVTVVLSSSNPNATCPLKAYEPVHEPFRMENGSLWAGTPEQRYSPSQYRNNTNGTGYEVYVFKCVFKCCPMDEIVDSNTDKCIPSKKTFNKELVPKFVDESGPVGKYEPGQLYLFYQKELICKQHSIHMMIKKNFGITENGWFYLKNLEHMLFTPDKFCIDWSNNKDVKMVVKLCWKLDENSTPKVSNGLDQLKRVLLMVSILLLIVTFLVYAIIKKLRNLNGKSLMCHIAALIVAYTSLLIAQYVKIEKGNSACIIIGYIIQYSALACFFWVNVLCFDLWWTFSGLRPLTKVKLKLHESTKFKIYSIYGWGCPITISLFTYGMQIFSTGPLNPKLGENACFFYEFWPKMIYFYIPMAVLFFIDIMMFIDTVPMISKVLKDNKPKLILFLKLFIVMAIYRTIEISSFVLSNNNDDFNIWYILDIINALIGVFICIIHLCQKRVLRLLWEVLCPSANLFKKSTMSSTKNTTESHET